MEQSNIALFVDYENFQTQNIEVKVVIDKLKERGRLIVKKAYADWGRFAKGKRQMLENSVELIEMPSHGHNKNSADIKLVVDALETAITKKYIDTIVVVSGDSDYTPLISKLREYNKYVIVVGSDRKSTSSLLKDYCDELLFYNDLIGKVTKDDGSLEEAYELLTRAVNYLSDKGIETRGSQVKQYIIQLNSSFSEIQYGFDQFKKLLEQARRDRIISLNEMETGGDYIVSLVDKNKISSEETSGIIGLNELIYFACQVIKETEEEGRINISFLPPIIRAFKPDFNLREYGYSNTQGFKALLEDYERKHLITLTYDTNKNQYYLLILPKFNELAENFAIPSNYYIVKAKSIINKKTKYTPSIEDVYIYASLLIEKYTNQKMPAKTLSSLHDEVVEHIKEEDIKLSSINRILDVILDSQCIKNLDDYLLSKETTQFVTHIDDLTTILEKTTDTIYQAIRPYIKDEQDEAAFHQLLHLEKENILSMM